MNSTTYEWHDREGVPPLGKIVLEERITHTHVLQGWECPRCKAIHSPSVLRCDCKPNESQPKPPMLGKWSDLRGVPGVVFTEGEQ